MFKRIERKLKKKQEEEELGIDEDMKEVLGIHDTDSDESNSDSEASGSSDEDEDEGGGEDEEPDLDTLLKKRKRLGSASEEEEESELDDAEGEDQAMEDDDQQSEDADENDLQISVEEALRDPLYIVSIQPDIRGCILCPGKLLKNPKMAEVHRDSQVSPTQTLSNQVINALQGSYKTLHEIQRACS